MISIVVRDAIEGIERISLLIIDVIAHSFYTSSLSSVCDTNNTREAIKLFIKVGEQGFRLEGQNSIFAVSDDLAKALQNSPDGNINIRIVTRSGETGDSKVGKGTVKAWKDIY